MKIEWFEVSNQHYLSSNPLLIFRPKIRIYILLTNLSTVHFHGNGKGNLFDNQEPLQVVITSFLLMALKVD